MKDNIGTPSSVLNYFDDLEEEYEIVKMMNENSRLLFRGMGGGEKP